MELKTTTKKYVVPFKANFAMSSYSSPNDFAGAFGDDSYFHKAILEVPKTSTGNSVDLKEYDVAYGGFDVSSLPKNYKLNKVLLSFEIMYPIAENEYILQCKFGVYDGDTLLIEKTAEELGVFDTIYNTNTLTIEFDLTDLVNKDNINNLMLQIYMNKTVYYKGGTLHLYWVILNIDYNEIEETTNSIMIGSRKINKILLQEKEITAIYKGNQKIYG